MELTERNKTVIIIVVLVALAAVSFFLLGKVATSEESFSGTYGMLDEKKTNVMELMGAAAATSTALSLIPGDAGTPMAEQFADLSGYFMFIMRHTPGCYALLYLDNQASDRSQYQHSKTESVKDFRKEIDVP